MTKEDAPSKTIDLTDTSTESNTDPLGSKPSSKQQYSVSIEIEGEIVQ